MYGMPGFLQGPMVRRSVQGDLGRLKRIVEERARRQEGRAARADGGDEGADQIVARLTETYGVVAGQTTPDGNLTLSTARCLGSCGMAPVAVIDGQVRGHLDATTAVERVAAALQTDAEVVA